MRSSLLALSLGVLLSATGCNKSDPIDTGPDTDAPPAEETAACEARDEAGREMTAGETPDTTAPLLPIGTEPATVTLVQDRANYVRVEITEPGTFVLYGAETGVIMDLQQGVDALTADDPVPNESCADGVPERHDIVVTEPGTYHLRFAWAGFRSIWVYAVLLPEGG